MSVYGSRPSRTPDATAGGPSRADNYLGATTTPIGQGRWGLAYEGSYFTATNATVGTALTAHAAPAIADTDTKSIIHGFNASATTAVTLDYIWIKQTVVNASATASDFMLYIDTKGTTARSSGGTAITPNNTRSDSTNATAVTMFAGAVVTAPTASRKVAQRTVRPVISVAEDQYTFCFGNGLFLPSSQALTGTSVASVLVNWPPVVIGPLGNFMFVQTSPSGASTAMTFEFEMGWSER